ncbi:ATP-binding cassette sub-family A member 8-A [Cricetulus griseus]|uniref:ATP-binding cassette sub-family A member 8-A n=1 Tax=Cricetulus griseus TaxID=10029 RepID=G3H851_CRIGR|nr:ATP-binding cassette sub-family A member 8-A [Cricetulus griseus]
MIAYTPVTHTTQGIMDKVSLASYMAGITVLGFPDEENMTELVSSRYHDVVRVIFTNTYSYHLKFHTGTRMPSKKEHGDHTAHCSTYEDNINCGISHFWTEGFVALQAAINSAIIELLHLDYDVNSNADPTGNPNVIIATIFMLFFDSVFYLVLTFYFEKVLPSEYGQRHSPLFFLKPSFWSQQNQVLDYEIDSEFLDDSFEPVSSDFHGQEAIRIRNLTKEYTERSKRTEALADLSLDIYKGQITAILGHSGAGKSTLLNILSGLCAPTKGWVTIYNNKLSEKTDLESIIKLTGVCPQCNVQFDFLTVRENLRLFAKIKGIRKHEVDNEIFLLDEPTAGLDPFTRHRVWNLLKERKAGRVVLFSTQFMDEADILADRKVFISKGKLKCAGSSLFLKKKWGIGYHLRDLERCPDLGIENCGVSITTLSEVFLKLEGKSTIDQSGAQIDDFIHSLEKQNISLEIDAFGTRNGTEETLYNGAIILSGGENDDTRGPFDYVPYFISWILFMAFVPPYISMTSIDDYKNGVQLQLWISGLCPSAYWFGQALVEVPIYYILSLSMCVAFYASAPQETMLTTKDLLFQSFLHFAIFLVILRCLESKLGMKTMRMDPVFRISPRTDRVFNNPEEPEGEDEDVRLERERTANALTSVDFQEKPAIIASCLRKEYKGKKKCFVPKSKKKLATRNISFCVRKGEVVGLLGHNGAGKSTSIKIITGEAKPSAGQVLMKGSSRGDTLGFLGYCPQENALWPNLLVREHLEIFAAVKGMSKGDAAVAIARLADALKLQDQMRAPVKTLSEGVKRKLCFALSILGNPSVVLLDEPSTGMDPEGQQQMWQAIQATFTNTERGALLTTHYMAEAEAVCDRVAIMVSGRLRCIGSIQHLKSKFGKDYLLEMKARMASLPQQGPFRHLMDMKAERRLAGWRERRNRFGDISTHKCYQFGQIFSPFQALATTVSFYHGDEKAGIAPRPAREFSNAENKYFIPQ